MSDVHVFMIFGAMIAAFGFWLAAHASSGRGKALIKVMGTEISVEAAGGILVILIGCCAFSVPFVIDKKYPDPADSTKMKIARQQINTLQLKIGELDKENKNLQERMDYPGIYSGRYILPHDPDNARFCLDRILGGIQQSNYKLRGTSLEGATFWIGDATVFIQCDGDYKAAVTVIVFGDNKTERSTKLDEVIKKANDLLIDSVGKGVQDGFGVVSHS